MLARVRATVAAARDTGALLSIETEQLVLRTPTTSFLVRKVANLRRKDAAAAKRAADAVAPAKTAKPSGKAPGFNPFLPYEEDMFVEAVSPSHVCLLNKFNVVENHILVVTRAFESQGSLLNVGDFAAVWHCLSELDGLAFYNAGRIAGASQRHKHAQIVPTPLVPGSASRTPFDEILASGGDEQSTSGGNSYSSPHLPFLHRLTRLDRLDGLPPDAAAPMLAERYTALLASLAVDVGIVHNTEPPKGECRNDDSSGAGNREHGKLAPSSLLDDGSGLDVCHPFPYNLLMTQDWLLIVPRRREYYEGDFEGRISVNSLGFCGSLFVRDDAQLAVVEKDPMAVLTHVAFPRPGGR